MQKYVKCCLPSSVIALGVPYLTSVKYCGRTLWVEPAELIWFLPCMFTDKFIFKKFKIQGFYCDIHDSYSVVAGSSNSATYSRLDT